MNENEKREMQEKIDELEKIVVKLQEDNKKLIENLKFIENLYAQCG